MRLHAGQAGRVAAVALTERAEAAGALSALARPRLTGSAGAALVEQELRGRLEALGYEIREVPFEFSTWPGRWGVPAAGAVLATATAAAALLLGRGSAGPAALVLAAAGATVLALFRSARAAIARLPWGRTRSSNWLVHQPGARPRYVVMAHRDSKSQPLPTLGRIAAGALAAGGWALTLALSGLAALDAGWGAASATIAAAGAGLAGGALLMLCGVGNHSPGALDNASGLAALLAIARAERSRADVAFLITDGEELGLAGAEALAPHLPPVEGIINLDGLDDEGPFRIAESYGWLRQRSKAPRLAAALLDAAGELGLAVERGGVPTGIMVDHVPFARAGHPAVTLMRGTFRSLLRVHRPADSVSRLTGDGVAA
ncbi:MAG TPA: M28 family peptidase, partial [Myxococcota bacterium]